MKKIFLFISLILCSSVVFAQALAIINDKDGYAVVRNSMDIKQDNIVDTLHNGHFICVLGIIDNWAKILFKNNYSGWDYVCANEIKYLSYPEIPKKFEDKNKVIFSGKNILVEIKIKIFDPAPKDVITFMNGGDGKSYKEYEYIQIKTKGSKYFLPKEAIKGTFEPNLHAITVTYDDENDILYIQSTSSDGAGFYYAIWKIEKGIYKERGMFSGLYRK